MKSKIYLLAFVICYGCNVSKNVAEAVTVERTEKKFAVDTTLKIVQPIQSFNVVGNYDEPMILETKGYKFESVMNFESGKREYKFEPKKDTITERVKVYFDQTDIKTVSKKETRTETKAGNGLGLWFWLFIALLLFILQGLVRYLLNTKNLWGV